MIILSDFDNTITTHKSISTIGLYSRAFPEYREELKKIREELLSSSMSSDIKTLKYAKKELELLSEYLKKSPYIPEELYELFELRRNFEALVKYSNDYGHELVISSSGIGNAISEVLRRNLIDVSNISIVSNFYDSNFEFNLENLVYSRKKYNEYILSKINEDFVLVGNHPCDKNMLPEYKNPILSICISDKKYDSFDYNLDVNSEFNDIIRLIKKV